MDILALNDIWIVLNMKNVLKMEKIIYKSQILYTALTMLFIYTLNAANKLYSNAYLY